MSTVLVIGAGRSSSCIFPYLYQHAGENNWKVIIADVSLELALLRADNHTCAEAVQLDIQDEEKRRGLIGQSDLVISMLPANMHIEVAKDCVSLGKHLLTASYVSPEMQELHEAATAKGVLLLNECGLDPGIDHMSAMLILDEIRKEGGKLLSFKSYTGGLIAPESDDNPWGYKFSWNPRNVILAGQGTARYIENGVLKYIPYHRLFASAEKIQIEPYGEFEGYANRDSLSYRKIYGIENIPTLLRGTLRKSGYCISWNILVNLGLTDDSYTLDTTGEMTYAELLAAFLPTANGRKSLLEQLAEFAGMSTTDPAIQRIEWTGLMSNKKIPAGTISPAKALQALLEEKWLLKTDDKDMIVMQHQFVYSLKGKTYQRNSSLVCIGEDANFTAMAKTVGLPLAIAAVKILKGEIKASGVQLPVRSEWYLPLLKELEKSGVNFKEQTMEWNAG